MSHPEQTAMEYRGRICLAMSYISENLDRDLALEEIARVSAFSKSHFHRIFGAAVGEMVSAFTPRLRLEWAANLLLSDRRPHITSIVMDRGFSSSQNFAKAFRQHFGMSPTDFRNSKRGNKVSKDGNVTPLLRSHDPDTLLDNRSPNERRADVNAEVRERPDYQVAHVRKMGPCGKKPLAPGIPGRWE